MPEPIFHRDTLSAGERAQLDHDGHVALPGLLTPPACECLTQSLAAVFSLPETAEPRPSGYAAEYDDYLAALIAHPQMLALARTVLDEDIRFDHCVALTRPPGNQGLGWHSHSYGDTDPELGFIRIFFYVNGFEADDGGLKVVPGSHLFREAGIRAASDDELRQGWMAGKCHPRMGEPLRIEALSAPPGTVVLMWTHALHAVTARRAGSPTRWTVVYAYRNPGEPSRARWITEDFERRARPAAEGLMSLY